MTLTTDEIVALLAVAAGAATLVAIVAVWFLLKPGAPPSKPQTNPVAIEVSVSSVTLTLTVGQRGEQIASVTSETPTTLTIGPTKID